MRAWVTRRTNTMRPHLLAAPQPASCWIFNNGLYVEVLYDVVVKKVHVCYLISWWVLVCIAVGRTLGMTICLIRQRGRAVRLYSVDLFCGTAVLWLLFFSALYIAATFALSRTAAVSSLFVILYMRLLPKHQHWLHWDVHWPISVYI